MIDELGAAELLFLPSRLSLSSKNNTEGTSEHLFFFNTQSFSKLIRTDLLLLLIGPIHHTRELATASVQIRK
jgi:hypothetical protein